MDKTKLLFGILIAVSSFIGYISYVTQILNYFYISSFIIVVSLVIIFLLWARRKNGKFFRIINGNFCLKGDMNLYGKITTRKFPDLLKNPNNYSVISILLLAIILHIPTHTLILTGLSVISAAAALSVVSFNYFNALKEDENQIIILASAKRYFLTTIYGIFMLMVLIGIKYLPQLPAVLTSAPAGFLAMNFNIFLFVILIVMFIFLVSTTLRFLVEGLYLSLKGTIKLEN